MGERCERICVQNHKNVLKEKFQCLNEGIFKQGNPTLLNEIYTEVYITEGGSGEVNDEHEVRQIEAASKRSATHDKPIKCNDIFKPLPGQEKDIRTVMTKGVAGIGKTVSVQKFILDWAEEKANQDVHFIFPLPFRELNLVKEEHLSLVGLIKRFFGDIKDFSIFTEDKCKVLFIFDGLDECRIPLNFHSNPKCCDVTEATTVSALLTNLIQGNLLPSALLWITSRPAAANQIPPMDQVTEVRGFNDPQKEEYFRKRVSDEDLASRTIGHLKSSRSLFIMCHIPVFCWIAATVLEIMLREGNTGEIPKTLTQMYTHFLMIQTEVKQRYTNREKTDEGMIFKLGKLAFQQLEKGNLIFYEEDLRECDIEVTEASVYSGVCTQIFREEAGLYQGKVFCFVHLSIQEHLAALYVHLALVIQKENVLKKVTLRSMIGQFFRSPSFTVSVYELHKTAVDLALQSKNGHLDLFLRFLLGLSLESNQKLLSALLPQTTIQSQRTDETVQYVKKKIRENPSSEKCLNLFHCLNELNDQSLVEEIQSYLKTTGGLTRADLSPVQWSAVVFVLLTSEQELDEFDLSKYGRTDKCLQGLLPVVKASRSAQLGNCDLTGKSCSSLAAALSSGSSLRQLDLRGNKLQDSGVALLSAALGNPLCQLETLTLRYCKLTGKSCSSLAAALSSGSSLRQLDLSGNNLQDSGVALLSAALGNPLCQLETLTLGHPYGTLRREIQAAAAASSSSSHSSDAAELHLTHNTQQYPGAQLLSTHTTQRGCERCAEVPDTSHWILVKPVVSTEKNISTYSLSSSAGSYQCSMSSLRWSCIGPINMQYHFMDWYVFSEELAHMQCSPAGPLMDIKLTSGELEEIHLPHFLCLGDDKVSVRDAVRVLHGHDSGVCVEVCELTRHHTRIVQPSLSPWGPVRSVVEYLFPPTVHCELLLFYTSTSPLKLHVYLVPNDPAHIQAIKQKEKEGEDTPKGVRIDKPGAVGPLRQDASVRVHVKSLCQSCKPVIQPEKMNLLPLSTSNYCEVKMKHTDRTPMEHPDTFDVEVVKENGETVCKRTIDSDDLKSSGSRGSSSESASKYMVGDKHFIDKNFVQLINGVSNVDPVLDRLRQEDVITWETYNKIRSQPTSEGKMRELLSSICGRAGAKDKLYEVLMEVEPHFMEEISQRQ
ncbi:NACHT, LRR and PYD domains-containing protein 3-like [Engraulis encrasicolus]|uniref:NACHT, LRR and PYD domains-containing protein 3-like n=1 Tax=Engraulis encrasicolus TaxID=184585 RepID=UPI002FD4C5E3